MDISSTAWLLEQEMDDPRLFVNQYQQTRPYNEFVDSFSSQSFKPYQDLVTRNHYIHPTTISQDLGKEEIYKATTTSSFAPICGTSSNTFTISFGDFTSPTNINKNNGEYKLDYHDVLKHKENLSLDELLGSIELPKRVPCTRRNRRQAQEHVLAERKRREKLTQRFISLSSLLPEIKKMDKATVLEDATKYIKHLQDRVKELEETSINFNRTYNVLDSTCSMWRSKIHGDQEHDASSFDETNSLPYNNAYHPGIKVRILGSNILVRIYCQRNSSLAVKALTEMERLHFTIVCNSVLRISGTAALITITAQMSEEFVMTATDLVKCLRSSLSSFL